MDDQRKNVGAMLRSVVQSAKEGIPVGKLPVEYKMIVGQMIPFKDLGYPNLLSMLKDMSNVVRLERNREGYDVVHAVADENTAHIQSLISRQKSSKPKPKPLKSFRRYSMPRSGTWKPSRSSMSNSFGNYINKSRPNYSYKKPLYERNFLDRVPSLPSSSPPPAVSARPKSSYVLPPRFQRQKEQAPVRANSPISAEPTFPVPERPQDFSSSKSQTEKAKRPLASSKSRSLESTRVSPPLTRTVTTKSKDFFDFTSTQPEIVKYVTYQPIIAPPAAPKRTVTVMPLDAKTTASDVSTASLVPTPTVINDVMPKKTQFKSKAETCKSLIEEYAVYNDYQALYRTLPITTKKRNTAFVSTLTLNNIKYLSYPTEKPTQEEAEEVAASKAVEALGIVPGQYSFSRSETPARTRPQMMMLVERLFEIIKSKPNGIWHTKLPSYYEKAYFQTLPTNWLQILRENCDNFNIDKVGDNYILYPLPAGKNSPTSPTTNSNEDQTLASLVKDCSMVNQPAELILPENKVWEVYITNISDALNIAVRLLDYSDAFAELADSMDNYYSKNQNPALDATIGRVYAVKSEESWFRIEVLSFNGDQAECYFLDNGDSEMVAIQDLNVLMPQFRSLPYQAIQCELYGVDYTESSVVYQKLFDMAFGKVLVAEIVSRDPVSLYLYDTSTEVDININDILNEVGNMEAMTPMLPEKEKIAEGLLTHITDDGDLYLQLCGNNLKVLENITSDIKQLCEDRKGSVVEASQSKMYCARYENGEWYRAFVRKASTENPDMVVVWYVDYGNTATVHVSNLCEVDSVSDMLALLPYQAIRCRLHNVPASKSQRWTKAATDFLYKIVPENQNTLIKVAKPGTDLSLPEVNLFERIGQQKELISVNETLALEADLFVTSAEPSPVLSHPSPLSFSHIPDVALSAHMSTYNKYNGYNEPPGDSSKNSLPRLLPATIPEVGNHFDINVTLAAHPHNFTVQPWELGGHLDDLMDEMQLFYNTEENICDMHECLLKEGEFYACRHKDGRWYRTSAVKVMSNQTVWVYFVDFGDYYMLTLNDLQPLYGKFRSLPFQAIKASLADVIPVEGDWTPLDCVHFQELVVDKQFVSIIKKKTLDDSNSLGGYELGLTLIDTSSLEKDVYVHDLLIQKGSAKLIPH